MKNRRNNLSHNGHSRLSHSKSLPKTIVSRAARATKAIGDHVPTDPVYRYGIPAGALIVGLAATGVVLRKQVFSIARTVFDGFDGLSFDGFLGAVGLERSRSMPRKIAPAAGALAIGLAAGAGAILFYLRGKDQPGPVFGTTRNLNADEGSVNVAP